MQKNQAESEVKNGQAMESTPVKKAIKRNSGSSISFNSVVIQEAEGSDGEASDIDDNDEEDDGDDSDDDEGVKDEAKAEKISIEEKVDEQRILADCKLKIEEVEKWAKSLNGREMISREYQVSVDYLFFRVYEKEEFLVDFWKERKFYGKLWQSLIKIRLN